MLASRSKSPSNLLKATFYLSLRFNISHFTSNRNHIKHFSCLLINWHYCTFILNVLFLKLQISNGCQNSHYFNLNKTSTLAPAGIFRGRIEVHQGRACLGGVAALRVGGDPPDAGKILKFKKINEKFTIFMQKCQIL